ncbi:ABC transporter permease subunit, partial [Lentzea kentuckyensis]|uniref:ABC transporter permease subunit n=1 Tax=Lentzea kentuckyensis TaxID=360086 RepID=UPI001B8000E3
MIARTIRERGSYLLFLIPGALLLVAVILVPFVMNVGISFTRWQGVGDPKWTGLDNYTRLFGDSTFWSSFQHNLALVVAMAILPTAAGLVIAAALFDVIGKRFGDRAASVLRACVYLPQVLPIAVAGIVWSWILAPQGALNEFLGAVGLGSLGQNWLGDPDIALWSVMGVMVWIQLGYPVVIFMAGLQRADPSLYEAAELDGASWWGRFWHVTVPQIRAEGVRADLRADQGWSGRGDERPVLLLVPELLREDPGRLRRRDRDRPHGADPHPHHGVPESAEPGRAHVKRHAVLWSLIVLAVVMLAPFVIVALNAVKSPAQYASDGPLALPSDITFQGIIDFWDRVGFGQKLLNSFIISGSVAVLAVVVSVLNAYALGIGRVRGRLWILVAFLVANTLPQEAMVYPLYFLAKETGLYDTQLSVIIIFTIIQAA